MDLAKLSTVQNSEEDRFELRVEEYVAFIQYKIGKSGNWYLVHTEVPEQIKNLGVGNKLVRESLNLIDEQGIKIIPSCPFVKAFIQRHQDDYRQLLVEGINL